MRRFGRIYDVVEPVEAYRRGGYHPVHLYDIFHDRYEVRAKLAFGQFSTVWLAYDQVHQQQVALKILKADASKDSKELSILLHLSGIIYCDLQPANITISPDEDVDLETHLEPPEPSPVRWLEGVRIDTIAPEYLLASQRRRGQLDGVEPSKLMVKIGDLGGAAFCRQREQWPVTPTALRAPELIHHNAWDASIDIWTLAEHIDKEHLYLIEKVLDKNHQAGNTFTKYLADRLPADFGAENIERLASFLSGMLQENAHKRMSTAELLNHPFLSR
ncbi:hypothetical protein RU639_007085 [Aspergillus parasiticus]